MRWLSKWLLAIVVCGFSFLKPVAQNCPARPNNGTVVADPFNISSQNGTLSAKFTLGHSVDTAGYTHYCYNYQAGSQDVEAPTLRVNPGDVLNLNVVDAIQDNPSMPMDMAPPAGPKCGDGGAATVNSTNVHFHGMNVPPVCHQDDVITTLDSAGNTRLPVQRACSGNSTSRSLLVPPARARLHRISGEWRGCGRAHC